MARSFYENSPYSGFTFSEEKCREIWDVYLQDKTRVIIILACDENPFGMIIGLASEMPFSKEKTTIELAWWCDPNKRGSRDSIMLMKAYEDWAIRIGAKMSQMAMLDDSTDLEKFYTRSGYRPAERSYIKEI